jgi:hypothetical protein
VDDHPERYSVKTLREYKKRHEGRIFELTGRHPDALTTALIFQGNIGRQAVQISEQHMWEAIAPRYLAGEPFCIDLTGIADGANGSFWDVGQQNIRERVERLYERRLGEPRPPRVSVFALGPIPLLVYLGAELSDKIPVDLYQRHRDTEDWTWKKTGDPVTYEIRTLQTGTDPARVAVVLSLSGTIQRSTWPAEIDSAFTVYEVTLVGRTPNPMFLRRREDLLAFSETYQRLLATILKDHAGVADIHLLPAIPAPIAVTCGRERLSKVHPALVVYDNDKAKGGFTRTIRIK